MADQEFNWEEIDTSALIEGLTAVLTAPIILPLAAGMSQPATKTAIKEAIAFSQRCREAVAEARERFEDVLAEAQAEVEQEQAAQIESPTPRPHPRSYIAEGPSAIAGELYNGVADLNAQVGWLTNGAIDLRFLLPAGLSVLALRQLVVKGMALDEIPWYTLAWYAFDTFYKFNQTDGARSVAPAPYHSPLLEILETGEPD